MTGRTVRSLLCTPHTFHYKPRVSRRAFRYDIGILHALTVISLPQSSNYAEGTVGLCNAAESDMTYKDKPPYGNINMRGCAVILGSGGGFGDDGGLVAVGAGVEGDPAGQPEGFDACLHLQGGVVQGEPVGVELRVDGELAG